MFLMLAACADSVDVDKPEPTTEDTISPPRDDDDTLENIDTAEEDASGGIDGTVRVKLMSIDENLEGTELSWEEATGGVWVFGSLFVGAFTYGEDGTAEWLSTETFTWPSVDGNDYSFDVQADPEDDIWVSAWLDWAGDGIIGTNDPTNNYPDAVHISDGERVEDVDITIWTAVTEPGDGRGGGWWGSGGGGGDYTYLWLSGDLDADVDYDGYPCHALLYDTNDWGPYFYTEVAMVEEGEGEGTGPWAMPAYVNWGNMKVVGGCDANWDGLLDPSDQWGSLSDGGLDDNPVYIGDNDIDDLRILVPFDGFRPFSSPIVGISGTVTFVDGFDALPQDATLHVVAMRYEPSEEMEDDDLSYQYAVEHIAVSDVEGNAAEFSLAIEPNTTTYLWAFLDNDDDGVVNEDGEYVGSYQGGTGTITVTTSTVEDISFEIGPVRE